MNMGGVATSSFGALPEPLEAGNELLVEAAHLAIENERPSPELPDGFDQVRKAPREILARATDETDALPILVATTCHPS